jgi:hypothetical protein
MYSACRWSQVFGPTTSLTPATEVNQSISVVIPRGCSFRCGILEPAIGPTLNQAHVTTCIVNQSIKGPEYAVL